MIKKHSFRNGMERVNEKYTKEYLKENKKKK